MSEIQIRRARVSEVDTIVELWMAMMHEHEKFDSTIQLTDDANEHYRRYLQCHILDTNAIVVVALHNGHIIGYTLAMKCQNLPMFEPPEYGYISDMTVIPTQRGKKIGEAMFNRVIEWFRQQSIRSIQLQVYNGNIKGKRFWNRMGLRDFINRCWLDL